MDYGFFDLLKLIGALGLFLYGMKMMSESLQKIAGNRLRTIISVMTTNRFTGVLTGTLVTTMVQSSSATTVMVVSFVNAGLLTLAQSIGVIMGANIGTTVTAWIISIFGFRFDMGALVLPLLAIGIPLIFSKRGQRKSSGEFLFGFSFLFMGLALMQSNAPDLAKNPQMLDFIRSYADMGFGSVLLFLLVGTIVTVVVQASSATMAITLIMCAHGWIDLHLGIALVMGENIGTTITANLAALTANSQAKRAALSHLFFNVFGVCWVLILFNPFCSAVSWIVDHWFYTSNYAVSISYKLSAFHTCFNVCNVLLLIWFIPFIEKTVTKLIPSKKDEDDDSRLKFISGGMLSTSELSILQAQKEIFVYGERVKKMFGFVKDLDAEKNDVQFDKIFERISKYESISDRMEVEIAAYLTKVLEGRLSNEGKTKIQRMLRVISEIESVADSCFNLSNVLERRRQQKITMTESMNVNMHRLFVLLDSSLDNMLAVLQRFNEPVVDISKSESLEVAINTLRDELKEQNLNDVKEQKYQYPISVIYMDYVSECEKMDDYIINVVEAVSEKHNTFKQ